MRAMKILGILKKENILHYLKSNVPHQAVS